jgi:tetratricopeptide (TPR) repeat protein
MAVAKKNQAKKNPLASNKAKPGIGKKKNYIPVYVISLLVLTFIVFFNSLHNFFITNLDDSLYIAAADNLKHLTSTDLHTMFFTFIAGNYHPLAILSLTIDFSFHGQNAFPFHLINLLFHLANVALVFWFIYLLLKRVEAAFIVALFFAIHPMHVESVAWISERKDVLYTFFFLASLIAYLIYMKDVKKYGYYIFSIVLFILSLMSKSAAVSLAPVIVLIDYYSGRKFNWKVIIEKIPFFLLSLLFGILAIFSQKSGDALNNLSPIFSFIDRLYLVSYGVMFYLVKLVAPFNLSAFHYYPDKSGGMLPWLYYLAPIGIAAIIFLFIKLKKIRKELLFGLLFFFFTIATVLQFLPVGFAIVAERYTYVPYIGLFFIAAKLYCDFTDNKFGNFSKRRKNNIVLLIAAFALFFSISTFERNMQWKNGIVLFDDIIAKNPETGHAYWARGNGKFDLNDVQGALADFELAIKYNHRPAVVYNNRANCWYLMDSIPKSIKGYNEAIKVDSTYAMAYYNRATANQKLKDYNATIPDYIKAIQLNFQNISWAYSGMGYSQFMLNNFQQALSDINKAIELKPDYSPAWFNKGNIEYAQKDYNAALISYNRTVELDPKNSSAVYDRGIAKLMLKDNAGACDDFAKASALGYTPATDAQKLYCGGK